MMSVGDLINQYRKPLTPRDVAHSHLSRPTQRAKQRFDSADHFLRVYAQAAPSASV
jgi:hypothetical protein